MTLLKPRSLPKKINLSSHISKLRKAEAFSGKGADDAILFWGTFADKEYLPYLKSCVRGTTTFVRQDVITTLTQIQIYCSQKHVTRVVSTSIPLLKKLLHWDKRKAPSLASYAGSYFTIPAMKDPDNSPRIEIVFIPPLKNLVTVAHGQFMATRIISKLTKPDKWYIPTPFTWELLKPENEEELFWEFEDAFLISIDIETFKENATIRCLSYTAFFYEVDVKGTGPENFIDAITNENPPQIITSKSVVLPMDSEYALAIMRKWNWELKAAKVFQNGKYDVAYLSRYNAPVYNWLYDTAHLFHAWYSELPKDLGFLNAFFIREAVYWKDLAQTQDLHEYYRYNALDTWGTGNVFLAMLLEAPKYAIDNYLLEFPLVFPCHLSEMTGIRRDMVELVAAREKVDKIIKEKSASLNTILGVQPGDNFNVKSPVQMKSLLRILGCSDLKSADEKNLKKARFRHPFNARVIGLVLEIRKQRTLREKYLQIGEKAKEFGPEDNRRILYNLNPHGTDSSRLASTEHHFWVGLQIQNIPRKNVVKPTMIADPGFHIGEADYEQAETRDTAYLSGDKVLIETVENSLDFHSTNAASFFGIPFNKIYDAVHKCVIDDAVRYLSKRITHGATYNMGPYVLVETMGEEKISEARQLLGLNRFWSYIQVAEYLLAQYHKTYPDIKKIMYEGIKDEIAKTKYICSKAVFHRFSNQATDEHSYANYLQHEPGWVRRCFGNPAKSKPALNSYIAHPPQSLNAQTLNRAYNRVFRAIAMIPEHSKNFKLNFQVHDSILFQYRIGHEYLCEMVRELMTIPITLRGYDGVLRTFTVPVDVNMGGTSWGNVK